MGTRERLIDASASALDLGGEAAVTLRAVANAVGVSHNTPYRHFPDRAALLAAVAERDFGDFLNIFRRISRSRETPIAKVRAALEAFIAYGEAHPARYRLLFSNPDIASHGGALEVVALETFAAFASLIQQAQDAGQLPELPTATLTALISATVHGLLDFKAGGRLKAAKGLSSVRDGASALLALIAPASDVPGRDGLDRSRSRP